VKTGKVIILILFDWISVKRCFVLNTLNASESLRYCYQHVLYIASGAIDIKVNGILKKIL